MTASVAERALPEGPLFHSPMGLFDFQIENVAEAYLRTDPGAEQGLMVLWSTGIGKSIFGMALSSLLFEDGAVDLVVVAAERNKIVDWKDDFARFTRLDAHLYHGQGRQKRLARSGTPRVLISTYETLARDLTGLAEVPGRKSKKIVDGPLMNVLGLRDKRVMLVLDEITALKSRGSQRHKSFAYVLGELRKAGHPRVFGLTATPAEADIEDAYNIGRIVCPDAMPTVSAFEKDYTRGRDPYGRYSYLPHARDRFGQLFQRHALIKHKTDRDVIAQFPAKVEKALRVDLDPAHRKLYDAVAETVAPDYDSPLALQQEQLALTALRMTAGHPASHLHAGNAVSKLIVETIGEEALRAVPSSKSVELISRLRPLVKGQGSQAIVFTFYGQSVLRALSEDLRSAGFAVAEYHGGNSVGQNEQAKNTFLSGGAEVLLASDAAARGLNLQEAQYVFEYESALSFALREQRINRVHRIGSGHPSVTCYTLVAQDTVEEGIVRKVLSRNRDHDALCSTGDEENYVTAADRKSILGYDK